MKKFLYLPLLALAIFSHFKTTAQQSQWTFLKGYGVLESFGVYGTKGVAANSSNPGIRTSSTGWSTGGKLYIFGGQGNALTGSGLLNDLWEYDSSTGNWKWLTGSNVSGSLSEAYGEYGVQETASSTNSPGARSGASSWYSNGKLYLFGGNGNGRYGWQSGYLNDLWEYNLSTGNWRWLSGAQSGNQQGVYGVKGLASSSNVPGGRSGSATWVYNGKLYLFGGRGYNSNSGNPVFNDIWEFDPSTNYWKWVAGSNAFNQYGVYGTKTVSSNLNYPGSRTQSVAWQSGDKAYIFGGESWAETGSSTGDLNDLWEYSFSTGNWRWLKGDKTTYTYGTYGTKGIASSSNTPGSRRSANGWTANGNLYLFGGTGQTDGFGSSGNLNDIWEYNPTTGNWTWVKGSKVSNQVGVYGTRGLGSSANSIGSRSFSISSADQDRVFLFGGKGYGTGNSESNLNDLWEYKQSTGVFTWLKGPSDTQPSSVFGVKNIASSENKPCARKHSNSWEVNGKLYLFGGADYSSSTSLKLLNDLWEYDPATNNWKWISGSTLTDQTGVYGTQGTATDATVPGSRRDATSWVYGGKLYLLGGYGYSSGTIGKLNDLWEFDLATGKWRWIKGSSSNNQKGTYGTKGVYSASNTPGGRDCASASIIGSKVYLFAGTGLAESTSTTNLNDLWEFDMDTSQWRWLKGINSNDGSGSYGTIKVASSANSPCARNSSTSWTSGGKLYIYGGITYTSTYSYTTGKLNDLWEYNPVTDNWTWIKGNNTVDQYGKYGTVLVADANNAPGSRMSSVGWEADGKLYLFGGYGFSASNTQPQLNDLWEYNISTGNWRWLNGSSNSVVSTVFATQGVSSVENNPGSRDEAVVWKSGNKVYLFSGYGFGVSKEAQILGDLWSLELSNTVPLDLLSFTARKDNDKVFLTWITAAERNVGSFKLEGSEDGINYNLVGIVPPKGAGQYDFIDTKPNSGTRYYKLGEISTNGEVKELGIRTVSFDFPKPAPILVYPNPVSETFHIQINADRYEPLRLQLINANGEVVIRNDIAVVPGSNKISVNLGGKIAPGQYVVIINGQSLNKTEKVIIK